MEDLVQVSGELAGMGVYVAYRVFRGVTVSESPPRLLGEAERVVEETRRRYASPKDLTGDPVVQAYRRLLWRLGIDPTKTRPSSEALARRVVRGGGLPRINNVVDAGNIASLEYMVPIGLYDLDRLRPPLTLTRCSRPCTFNPIGGRSQELAEGTPVLLDGLGRVVHVYPHRDSVETMITGETRNVLALAAGAPGVPRERARLALERLAALIASSSPSESVTAIVFVPG